MRKQTGVWFSCFIKIILNVLLNANWSHRGEKIFYSKLMGEK